MKNLKTYESFEPEEEWEEEYDDIEILPNKVYHANSFDKCIELFKKLKDNGYLWGSGKDISPENENCSQYIFTYHQDFYKYITRSYERKYAISTGKEIIEI